MWSLIRDHLLQLFKSRDDVTQKSKQLENEVSNGTLTPGQAADELIKEFVSSLKKSA